VLPDEDLMSSVPNDLADQTFVHRYWRSAPPATDILPKLLPGTISDDQFRLLADNIPTLCWAANGDGYIVWYNRRWHEYCGTTPAEMEGWGWQSVHDPAALPQVMELWTASIASGQPFEMTFPLRGADGIFRPFLTRIQPVRDASGNVARWFGANTEISAQVTAEDALRQSEERLSFLDRLGLETASLADADAVLAATTQLLGEHLKLSVCAYADMDEDEDGFTIRGDWAAPGSSSIVGHYSLADFGTLAVRNLSAGLPLVINDNLRELPPEESATFQAIGISATICMPLVKEGRLTALMAIHDRVPRVWTELELNLLREVTARSWAHVERVAAVAELRASEERYRTLFETVDAGFCVVEMVFSECGEPVDYQFIEANPAFERHTGLKGAVGRTALDLLPQLEKHWIERYGDVARTGRATRFESGSEAMGRWFDVHALRVGDPARARVAILFNDITERRSGEERLRHLNDTLEQRVVERTADLENAHEQLRQSQKLEAMGQLTGGVAHDFNNLLTPIIGSLDMLVRRELGSERERRLIDGALQSAERAKTLVQRLLAFARRQPLQPTAVDLNVLVRGMAELIASTSGPRIDVRTELPEDLPPAVADANQLEMAVLNLAVNARDAMPEGGVLTISTAQATLDYGHPSKLSPGPYLRLSVADTGMGMDEDTLSRAVEPFFSTKGIGKGTGLGLSMVHGLALQLDGSMTIFSRPGEGTTVELWLPISSSSASDESSFLQEPPRRAGVGIALLVDDEDLVRMSTADMLTDLGYKVVEARSAEEAMENVRHGLRPDLLVTDHLMPGMNGAELTRQLRRQIPRLPALIVSGYAEAETVAPELHRLAKPFRASELAESLSAVRKEYNGWPALDDPTSP
jgi:PAS domain S-box-containing protein